MIERIDKTLSRLDTIKGHYESPPEEMLGERICAALAPSANYSAQVSVCTAAGIFRLDMLLVSGKGRRVGIEVDGREFHDPQRDHWRTVFILCTGKVDVIYRVPAFAAYSNLAGVLAGLAAIEPEMFRSEEMARWRLTTERHWPTSSFDDDSFADGDPDNASNDRNRCGYGARFEGPSPKSFRMDAETCAPQALNPYVDFIRETGLRDIDQLKDAWEARRRQNVPPQPKIFDDLIDDE